jgi:putative peptidoglycan lipid II flippase
MTVCYTVGTVVTFAVQLGIVYKSNIRPKWNLRLSSEIKTLLKLMLGFMLIAGVREINTLADKYVASLLPTGSVSILSYANRITVAEVGLISTALSTVVMTQLSKMNGAGNYKSTKRIVVKAMNSINFVFFPLSLFTIVCSMEIASILYGRGNFSGDDIRLTASVMAMYAVGLVGYGMQDILTQSMIAFKSSKYTVIGSVFMVCSNIILNFSLYSIFGVTGVAVQRVII